MRLGASFWFFGLSELQPNAAQNVPFGCAAGGGVSQPPIRA
jgi:hypothetical protein